jgi:hypothetical protein
VVASVVVAADGVVVAAVVVESLLEVASVLVAWLTGAVVACLRRDGLLGNGRCSTVVVASVVVDVDTAADFGAVWCVGDAHQIGARQGLRLTFAANVYG